MKITFVVPSLNISGGLRVVAQYAELLARTHQVTIVSPAPAKPTLKQQLKSFLAWNGYRFDSGFNDIYFRKAAYQVRVVDGVSRINDQHLPDADVVIATFWLTAVWVAALSSCKGVKFYFVQGDERQFNGIDPSLVAATYQLPLYQITVSNALVRMLQQEFMAPQTALVPNSIDHHQFYAPPRSKQAKPTIGFLYSESTFKGLKTALAVVAQVNQQFADLQIMCFGSVMPGSGQLPAHYDFHLKPEQDALRYLYASCDVWLCCSTSEGFGLTVLEAMACRTPVVTTRCGGPEDFVEENHSGFFADVDDVDALSAAVSKVLQASQAEWQAWSDGAYQTAKSYSWQQAARLFEKALIAGVRQQKVSHHVL